MFNPVVLPLPWAANVDLETLKGDTCLNMTETLSLSQSSRVAPTQLISRRGEALKIGKRNGQCAPSRAHVPTQLPVLTLRTDHLRDLHAILGGHFSHPPQLVEA